GMDGVFPTRDVFSRTVRVALGTDRLWFLDPKLVSAGETTLRVLSDKAVQEQFRLLDPNMPGATNPFKINTVGLPSTEPVSCRTFIANVPRQSLFNHMQQVASQAGDFVLSPCAGVRNHLIFVDSELGQSYYAFVEGAALYASENDPLISGGRM